MRSGERVGEDDRSDTNPTELVEVQRRLEDIQSRRRDRVRWQLSRHTAELALRALSDGDRDAYRRSGKSRRRKRRKRLL